MADYSVPDIKGVLKRLDIVDDKYQDIINNLSPLYSGLNVSDIEKNVEMILPYSECKKITSRKDLPFLTLNEEERNAIVKGFESTDNNLKLPSLFYFKFSDRLDKMFSSIKYCIEQGIPYKDENNLVYDEIFNYGTINAVTQNDDENIVNQSVPFDYEIDRRNRR